MARLLIKKNGHFKCLKLVIRSLSWFSPMLNHQRLYNYFFSDYFFYLSKEYVEVYFL